MDLRRRPDPTEVPAPLRLPVFSPELSADLARIVPAREHTRRTRILAIVNLTPDSFHDGGTDDSPDHTAHRLRRLVDEGADALDLGAESTRPGAATVPPREELNRLLPALEVARDLGIPISVDTTKAAVAREALAHGAAIVNDVSALEADPDMAQVVAAAGAAIILMHRRGTPETMQGLAVYDDVVAETLRYLEERMEFAVRAGIAEERILLDPGIGFAKTADQSLAILQRLGEYTALGRPVVLGASRKSFLKRLSGKATGDRLPGTLAVGALGILAGASLLRVHDVEANVRMARTTEAVLGAGSPEPTVHGTRRGAPSAPGAEQSC